MTEQERPKPFYIADDGALDFLNSVGKPWATQIDWLENGRDLLNWLELAGTLPSDVAMRFRTEFPKSTIDNVAKQARDLREWLRGFVKSHSGNPLGVDVFTDIERINRLLEGDNTYRQIVRPDFTNGARNSKRQSLLWQRERRWHRPEDLLLPIAEAIGELVCSADFSLVRNCEGPACTLWFHDISKNHTRRWCTMSVCGNRAKAAAHRARKRSGSPA